MENICVFLNGARGLAVVETLVAHGHGVSGVFVPKDRAVEEAIVAVCARSRTSLRGVEDVNAPAFVRDLKSTEPRLIVIAGFSTIFKRSLIEAAELGTINLHAGRVPQYRGGSPLNWQIINGERAAGISVLRVEEGIDIGDVLTEAEIPIGAETTIADLHEEANRLFPGLVLDVVFSLETGPAEGRPQDESAVVYWHQRNDEDGRLYWHRSTAEECHRLIRAVTQPYPGAFTYWDSRKVRIFAARLPEVTIRGVPGRVCYIQGRGPYVVCADRAILVEDYVIEDESFPLPHGIHLD